MRRRELLLQGGAGGAKCGIRRSGQLCAGAGVFCAEPAHLSAAGDAGAACTRTRALQETADQGVLVRAFTTGDA